MEVEYGLGMQVIVAYMFDSWEWRMAEERGQQTRGFNGDGSLFSILHSHKGSSQASS